MFSASYMFLPGMAGRPKSPDTQNAPPMTRKRTATNDDDGGGGASGTGAGGGAGGGGGGGAFGGEQNKRRAVFGDVSNRGGHPVHHGPVARVVTAPSVLAPHAAAAAAGPHAPLLLPSLGLLALGLSAADQPAPSRQQPPRQASLTARSVIGAPGALPTKTKPAAVATAQYHPPAPHAPALFPAAAWMTTTHLDADQGVDAAMESFDSGVGNLSFASTGGAEHDERLLFSQPAGVGDLNYFAQPAAAAAPLAATPPASPPRAAFATPRTVGERDDGATTDRADTDDNDDGEVDPGAKYHSSAPALAALAAAALHDGMSDDEDFNEEPWFADPFGVNEYTEEFFAHLRATETRLRPPATFMEVQPDINLQMRAILVDWLVEVCADFRLTITTLHTAVAYIDRFLANFVVQRRRLQLVGITCLLLAAKYEEVQAPTVEKCVNITNNSYTAAQVLNMEHLVLQVLQYQMGGVTPVTYSERLLQHCPHADDQMESLFQYLVELTLKDADVFLRYRPSIIAAAAVSLSLLVLHQPIWSPMLALYSGLSVADFAACATDLYYTLTQAHLRRQRAVLDKYNSPYFYNVASLPIPPFPHAYVH